jgi:hypothetical protein
MKSICTSFLFAFLLSHSIAQNIDFTLADPQPEIFEVYYGTAALGDLDGDGDIDLVQSGIGENLTGQSARVSVFLNNGAGQFTITVQNFNNFWTTERTVMSDMDNDGDLDLIISGSNRTDFYKNDGQALFTYEPIAPFMPSDAGEIIIGDVDGDDDNDVIQYGSLDQSNGFATLFLNDDSGNFTQSMSAVFTPYINARIEYIDLEGDGDLDLLSFGENENGEAQMSIYENDGQGNFTLFIDSNVNPLNAEKISVGDIDNDGDEDFLISGLSDNSEPNTLLYLNDGSGQFSTLINSPFPNIFAGSSAFSDLDNDGDLDLLLIGAEAGGIPNIHSIVFENLGNNDFLASDSLGGEYIAANAIADLNGDGKKDILIQGFVDDTNVYWNNTDISTGLREFLDVNISVFPNPSNGNFKIQWDKTSIFNLFEIFDIQGNRIYGETLSIQSAAEIELDIAPGSYSIRLTGENASANRSVLVEN